jgi:hypothetical protein
LFNDKYFIGLQGVSSFISQSITINTNFLVQLTFYASLRKLNIGKIGLSIYFDEKLIELKTVSSPNWNKFSTVLTNSQQISRKASLKFGNTNIYNGCVGD